MKTKKAPHPWRTGARAQFAKLGNLSAEYRRKRRNVQALFLWKTDVLSTCTGFAQKVPVENGTGPANRRDLALEDSHGS